MRERQTDRQRERERERERERRRRGGEQEEREREREAKFFVQCHDLCVMCPAPSSREYLLFKTSSILADSTTHACIDPWTRRRTRRSVGAAHRNERKIEDVH